jgi:hypothetical protein
MSKNYSENSPDPNETTPSADYGAGNTTLAAGPDPPIIITGSGFPLSFNAVETQDEVQAAAASFSPDFYAISHNDDDATPTGTPKTCRAKRKNKKTEITGVAITFRGVREDSSILEETKFYKAFKDYKITVVFTTE